MAQNVISLTIVFSAVAFTIYSIINILKRSKPSKCAGCAGCMLKQNTLNK
jgi:hypothetical protein